MDEKRPELGVIKNRYTSLMETRNPFLTRAYKYSKITLPYLLPEQDDVSSTELQVDYASVGAEYVNHLSNVYLDTMFPVHRSFFKLQMPLEELTATSKQEGIATTEIVKIFALTEKEARWKFEKKHARVATLDFLKQLIVTGNSMLYFAPDDELVQNYALDQYVIYRDNSGKILEIITVDKKSIMSLDEPLRTEVMNSQDDIKEDTDLYKKQVDIYTYIRRDPENPKIFLVDQAVESITIGEQDSYPENLLPWIPCYWNRTRREIYGRGLVEDHYGAFFGMSILVEALVIAGAITTDFKFLVKPGSMLDIVEMNNAASGTYHYGNPDDVAPIDMGKRNEMEFVLQLVDMYRKQLGKIFMVLSSQLRSAERVTAEENRLRAQELNKAHGGVFGNLGLTLQSPIAELLLRDLDILIKDSGIEPVVMTGLDAMGRASENEKMLYFFNDIAAMANVPPEFLMALKKSAILMKLGIGRDIDTSVIMSEDELAAEQEKAQQAQMTQQALGDMTKNANPEQIAEGLSNAG